MVGAKEVTLFFSDLWYVLTDSSKEVLGLFGMVKLERGQSPEGKAW